MHNDDFKDFIIEIDKYPFLSKSEENKLFIKAQRGDIEARNKLFFHNLYLVKKYANEFSNLNVSFEDLFQYGCITLLNCIDYFNSNFYVSFSAYFNKSILNLYRTIIMNKNSICNPNVIDKNLFIKLMKIKNNYVLEFGYLPTIEELSELSGVDIITITKLLSYDYMLSLEEAKEDNDLYNDNLYLEDSIISKCSNEVEVNNLIKHLTKKQLRVIEYVFGLNGKDKKNYSEIAKEESVSKQTINVRFYNSLNRLRKLYF